MTKLVVLALDDIEWISDELLSYLKSKGLVTILDLVSSPISILREFGLSNIDSTRLIERSFENLDNCRRGTDVNRIGMSRLKISTGSLAVDSILGGGVSTGRVTDFFGESGTGKTQLCFQICLNTQLLSGDRKDVVFVDTAGTFRPERISEISSGILDRNILFRNIFLVTARTSHEQVEVLRNIKNFDSPTGVRTLIIDTLTENFVYDYQEDKNLVGRQSALTHHLHDLAITAIDDDIAVIVTNTVRSRLSDGKDSTLVETGGLTVSQGAHVRVRLEKVKGELTARMENTDLSARFKIGKKGIEDVVI